MEISSILIGLIIDLRLIRNRKYILVFVNLCSAICMFIIFSGYTKDPQTFFFYLFAIKCFDLIMCCIKNAYHI